MYQLYGLIIWFAVFGYYFGRKKGKGGKYALISIPVSLATYFAIFIAMARLASFAS